MATLLDYLDWFGDISLDEVPFNEVDALVLAQLSYVDLNHVVPRVTSSETITVKEASEIFFATHNKEEVYSGTGLINPLTPFVLQKMAEGRRWSNQHLFAFSSLFDNESHEQFAALSIELNGEVFLAFRGTDETFAGWREDCMMSFEEVAAQKDALAYLQALAERISDKPLILGGHSKGGNLAAYAAANAEPALQNRISDVWCMDSPGFDPSVPTAHLIQTIASKIHLYIPEFCIVAALMEQATTPVIIKSSAGGAVQHDAMSWQVMGRKLVRATHRDETAIKLTQEMNSIITSRNLADRKKLTDSVFTVFNASGISSLDEIKDIDRSAFKHMREALNNIDEKDRETIRQFIFSVISCTMSNVVSPLTDAVGQALNKTKAEDDEDFSIEDFKNWKETRHIRSIKKGLKKIIEAPKALLGEDEE